MANPFEGELSAESQAERTRKIRAWMAFLQEAMFAGSRPAAEVEAEAIDPGFTHATIATARARLSIRSRRQGNGWIWMPPKPRKKQSVTP